MWQHLWHLSTILGILGFFCVTTDLYGNYINTVDGRLRKFISSLEIKRSDSIIAAIFGIIAGLLAYGIGVSTVHILLYPLTIAFYTIQHGIDKTTIQYYLPLHHYASLNGYTELRFYLDTFLNRSVFWGSILMLIGLFLSVISVEMISIAVGVELLRAIERITFKHFLLLIGAGLTVAALLIPDSVAERAPPSDRLPSSSLTKPRLFASGSSDDLNFEVSKEHAKNLGR
jgi:hypothetical protein